MTAKFPQIFTLGIFLFIALGIGAFLIFPAPWEPKKNVSIPQSRLVIPQSPAQSPWEDTSAERRARAEEMTLKAPLEDGEILAALLNLDFDGDLQDEQIVAYRNLLETESPIYLTYIDYFENLREYRRTWTAPAAATRPGTLSLYTQDLVGDRGICVLLSGMNALEERTLTIFRKTPPGQTGETENPPFAKIGEIRIDGSIGVREVERTQAYQMGMAQGQSYSIAAYGRDSESSNMLDQVEITYTYNEAGGIYEQSRINRIPGAQIEERRVRELLRNPQAFEEFITGLWYYISPQGTLDNRQYIYFDPSSREIIFYGDETQQVFTWQDSIASRYGLYISSQNISVSTLRRSIDIELESLESVRVKVFEDVRLKIGVNAPWDGSYRKAGSPRSRASPGVPPQKPYISGVYDSPLGRISFFPDGSFESGSGETIRRGKYAFFSFDGREILEMRSLEDRTAEIQVDSGERETYLVESEAGEAEKPGEEETEPSPEDDTPRKSIALSRVRLGARGIQELHEGIITLTLAGE